MWRPDLDCSHGEAQKIAHLVVPYTRGKGIDVGSGPHRLFKHWMTVDSGKDFNGQKVADFHMDGGGSLPFGDHSLDFVFSSHFLEHVVDYKAALAEWWRMVKPGGFLVLYLPHADLYPRCGQPGSNPDHKHDFVPFDIHVAMEDIVDDHDAHGGDWREVETRDGGDEYSFLMVLEKHKAPGNGLRDVAFDRNPDGRKRALVARFGAYGDMMMASSVFPHLREQGYHVTVATTPRGRDVIHADPHVDEIMLQDDDQMPASALVEHVRRLGERFDKVIHLTGSLEQHCLLHPAQVGYWHDDETRRRLYGSINYLETTHDIAGVPRDWRVKFYPTQAERAAAEALHKEHPFMIMLSLSGSSVHKAYPHIGLVTRILLRDTNATVILVGDKECQILEQFIAAVALNDDSLTGVPPDELRGKVGKRLLLRSGVWSIRESLAHAQLCHAVAGPETGVLNAVSMEESVAKVVLLSHSSQRNLTWHWKNTASLSPKTTCHPCHRLHYGFENCRRDADTGAAQCAADIHPRDVIEAMRRLVTAKQQLAAE